MASPPSQEWPACCLSRQARHHRQRSASAGHQHHPSGWRSTPLLVADRDAYTGVTAYWQDNKAAEKKKVEVKRKKKAMKKEEQQLAARVVVNKKENELLVGSSENVKELRHAPRQPGQRQPGRPCGVGADPARAAEFDITLAKGRPELYPEQPTTVRGFKPQIDEADWLLTQVVHDLTNQGCYRTACSSK